MKTNVNVRVNERTYRLRVPEELVLADVEKYIREKYVGTAVKFILTSELSTDTPISALSSVAKGQICLKIASGCELIEEDET